MRLPDNPPYPYDSRMELSFKLSDELDPVALAAFALAATHAFVSIIRWWLTRKAAVFVVKPSQILVGMGQPDTRVYIGFEVRNIGDKPFVVRGVYAKYWPSRFAKLIGREPQSFYCNVADWNGRQCVPQSVPVGEIWSGLIHKDAQMAEMLRDYILFEVSYSLSDKPLRQVVTNHG